MYTDNILAYIAPISGMIIISGLVALKNIHSRLNQLFVLFAVVATGSIACSYISHSASSNHLALICTRTALVFADFIPLAFYLFSLGFIHQLSRKKSVTYTII